MGGRGQWSRSSRKRIRYKSVGTLSQSAIDATGINHSAGETIYIGSDRKGHISKHKDEFTDFNGTYNRIGEIIGSPDYIGKHPNGQSIEFVKRLEENTLVAVRINQSKLTVRTMHTLSEVTFNKRLAKGRYRRYN